MIYFDNAATTRLDDEVIEEMTRVMNDSYGNPSSIHQPGQISRVIIEEARKKIAEYINTIPAEIIFTSGATEAINIAIFYCINYLNIKNIITSKIEHPAVLNTIQYYSDKGLINIKYVRMHENGMINLESIETNLKDSDKTLVCLMHANNEIGNLLPLKDSSEICRRHNAIFLSDMVQTMGKYNNNLKNIDLDFTVCSAHKFHGPKGIGFLYINKNFDAFPVIHGGGQERNIRSGTENLYSIAGLAKAFEIAHRDMDNNLIHITTLKNYMIEQLRSNFDNIVFNGDSEKNGLHTILNISFPENIKTRMLVQKLDINGIAVSGGSACHSANEKISYILREIGTDINRVSIRFSFSKFNTQEEIDICISTLNKILN